MLSLVDGLLHALCSPCAVARHFGGYLGADCCAGRRTARKSRGLSATLASVCWSSVPRKASRACRKARGRRQHPVTTHWLPVPKHSTSAQLGSVLRTPSPSRILSAGRASVRPPDRPRTAVR